MSAAPVHQNAWLHVVRTSAEDVAEGASDHREWGRFSWVTWPRHEGLITYPAGGWLRVNSTSERFGPGIAWGYGATRDYRARRIAPGLYKGPGNWLTFRCRGCGLRWMPSDKKVVASVDDVLDMVAREQEFSA